jgi:hypothetical protein
MSPPPTAFEISTTNGVVARISVVPMIKGVSPHRYSEPRLNIAANQDSDNTSEQKSAQSGSNNEAKAVMSL